MRLSPIVALSLVASAAFAGESTASASRHSSPFLTAKAWKPTVRVLSNAGGKEARAQQARVEAAFLAGLKRSKVPTLEPRADEKGLTPELELTIVLSPRATTCFANASEQLPNTDSSGIVWQSGTSLQWEKDVAGDEDARIKQCIIWVVDDLQEALRLRPKK